MKVKEESEKADLKLKIQKMKIMACGLITLWQIDGETMQTVRDFILGGFKITTDGDCSHKIKRCLLLGRKTMTKMLKLKVQYFGHLMQRSDSFEETLMLGKIEGRRRRGQQRI